MSGTWLAELAAELHRYGLDPEAARGVVAEAAAHLRDGGEDPLRAFGPARRYAEVVAESLRPGPDRRPRPGPVRLRATGISKRYGRRGVLDDVSLTVRSGQIAAVVGANGSGKSTFLRICAGLDSPDAGTVAIDGSVAYCPQDGGTLDFLLPDEHYVLVGAGSGLSRRDARDAGRALAADLGWRDPAPTVARRLSGGTRQKLNLTLSALTGPELLLLDEPYQGFDRDTYLTFWGQLWQLRDRGAAIVVVTHLLHERDRVDVVLDLTGTAR